MTADDGLQLLLSSRETFLRFLEKRVGDRADAEDILQAAFMEASRKLEDLRDDERIFGWFYAILRNRITDFHRRRSAARRAHEKAAALESGVVEPDTELFDATCRCVNDVLDTLTPGQSRLLRDVYVDDRSLSEVAASMGVARNSAGVRLHRARTALREALTHVCRACAEHGCLDCSCTRGRPL